MPPPKEDFEWKELAKWLETYHYKFTHIANEIGIQGKVGMLVNMRKIRQGLHKGFPDYCIILKSWSLLFIELKRARIVKKNGELGASPSEIKPEQLEWVESLNKLKNVWAYMCFWHKEAIKLIVYLDNL